MVGNGLQRTRPSLRVVEEPPATRVVRGPTPPGPKELTKMRVAGPESIEAQLSRAADTRSITLIYAFDGLNSDFPTQQPTTLLAFSRAQLRQTTNNEQEGAMKSIRTLLLLTAVAAASAQANLRGADNDEVSRLWGRGL